MRTLTILVPDDLAERLEAEAAAAQRDLAEPPAWVTALQPQNLPTDGTNGMHRVVGALETSETDEEIVRLLQEES